VGLLLQLSGGQVWLGYLPSYLANIIFTRHHPSSGQDLRGTPAVLCWNRQTCRGYSTDSQVDRSCWVFFRHAGGHGLKGVPQLSRGHVMLCYSSSFLVHTVPFCTKAWICVIIIYYTVVSDTVQVCLFYLKHCCKYNSSFCRGA
jgi:hypothetical protein